MKVRIKAAAVMLVLACVSETSDDEPATSCDMIAQDCGAGQKCVAYTAELLGDWIGTACVDASPDGSPIGSICFTGVDGIDTCGPDSMCLQLGTGEGVCFPFCVAARGQGTPSCAELDGLALNCERLDRDQTQPIAEGVHLCQLDCDPLLGSCPANVFGCYPGDSQFSCQVSKPGAQGDGYPCENHLECATGTLCTEPNAAPECESSSCCTSYCELGAAGACEGSLVGQDCVALFEPGSAPAGHELVGICS